MSHYLFSILIPSWNNLAYLLPPNIVHRDVWDLVGGYSIEFSPGMGSDPDFMAKLYLIGVETMKGLADCRVYHFEQKSTMRLKKNNYSPQFLFKWGILNSTLRKYINRRGMKYTDYCGQINSSALRVCRVKAWIKGICYSLKNEYGSLHHIWKKNDRIDLFRNL